MILRKTDATNVQTYEKKYGKDGYGLQYPDGHVIRIHRQVLEYELGMKGGKLLDYGCGNGVHAQYMHQQGNYEPYGCDISHIAIEQAKILLPNYADNFHVIPPLPELTDFFKNDFDLVFSNQVLYYLNDEQLNNMVSQMYSMLRPGGVIFATMMSTGNYYHSRVTDTENGLSRVVLTGRLNETSFINFKTREETRNLFDSVGFKKIQLGEYGGVYREDEGSRDHWIYVGIKA
jgi:2-polyprenyl-3-methyl-5-hydroxy-6-metoxy-1,4-benzoquinol methylase